MNYAIEVLQDNDLWEEIEAYKDYALVFKWYQEWQKDLPDKKIRLVKKEHLMHYQPKPNKREEIKIWDAVSI